MERGRDMQRRSSETLEEALETLRSTYSETIGSARSWIIGHSEYRAAYERVHALRPVFDALAADLRQWRAETQPESESREAAIGLLRLLNEVSEARAALEEHCWKMWRKIRFEDAYPLADIQRDILAAKTALSRAREDA